MDPVIELDGLEVRFGERVILNRLKAALTAAHRPARSQRRWQIHLINTLLASTSRLRNRAHFGRDIRTDAREVRSLVGYMPENDAFIADMSGVHFVRLMPSWQACRARTRWSAPTKHSSTSAWRSALPRPGHLFAGHEAAAKLAQAIATVPTAVSG